MTSPVAFGLGPLETIVDVGWGTLPVYVSVYCVADRTGAGSPDHTAAVTLSALAIEKGCEIVLNTGGAFGSPYNAYFKLVVIKAPKLVKGILFSLALGGTSHQTDFDPPTWFCGIYEFEQTITHTGTGTNADGSTYEIYNDTIRHLTPDGETTTSDTFYQTIRTPGDTYHTLIHDELVSWYDGPNLHTTNLPCDTPPAGRIDLYPFSVEVVANPIKDHVVINPGVAAFFDPAQAVKKIGSGDYQGTRTSVWDVFVDNHIPGAPSGLTDGTIAFTMQSAEFSVKRKEKIIEIYPSTSFVAGGSRATYSPGFRLNNFVKFPPPFNRYTAAWAGGYHAEFPEVILYAGNPPPPVIFDPFLYPP